MTDLETILASSLGNEKASDVVRRAAKKLGLERQLSWSQEECRQVLEQVGTEGGLVLAASRIASLRLAALAD